MQEFLELFKTMSQTYGDVTAIIVLISVGLIYSIYTIAKNYRQTITKYIEHRLEQDIINHTEALKKRKIVTPKIKRLLSELVCSTHSQRSMLFEYSNGTSNLVGLPFLYVTATSEIVSKGVKPIADLYQKINTSIISDFLETLENEGCVTILDLEAEKDVYPMIYNLMNPNKINSIIFYAIYGINDDVIGFIAVTSESSLCKKEAMPRMAETAQVISALVNYDKIEKIQ